MLEYKNTNFWAAFGHTFYALPLNKDSIALNLGAATALFSHKVSGEIGCHFHTVEALPKTYEVIEETGLLRKTISRYAVRMNRKIFPR